MAKRQEEREIKLQKLKDGELTAKQRADFYYKMAKIIEKDIDRLKELITLLEASPDSSLEHIDLKRAAVFAMELTEVLIKKSKAARIGVNMEKDGRTWGFAERFYKVKLGNSLPGIKNAIIDLDVTYKPTKEDIRFYERLRYHIDHIMPLIPDDKEYSFMDFTEKILPSIRAKDPGLKIRNRGIIGYAPPEKFEPIGEPKPIDPKLLDVIRKVTKDLGTDMHGQLTVIPDYPKVEDEIIGPFLKGDYASATNELITKMKERQKREEPK